MQRYSDYTSYEAVILAAGLSSRMGRWKMVLPFRSSTVIETVVDTALSVCSHLYVVGGHRFSDLYALLSRLPDVTLIENSRYRDGMFSSIRRGVEEVSGDRFFIALGDMPLVEQETYRRLIARADEIGGGESERPVVMPRYSGKPGHPVLLPAELKEEILAADPASAMLSDILSARLTEYVDIADHGVTVDFDTPEDAAPYIDD